MSSQKQQVVDLLKAIGTGAPKPVEVINTDKYIQHNLAAADGLAGFRALLKAVPKGAEVNTVSGRSRMATTSSPTPSTTSSGHKSASTSSDSKTGKSSNIGTICRTRPTQTRAAAA